MTCTEFLEGFSDWVDGDLNDAEARAFEAHRDSCTECARYTRVWSEGRTLLQAFSSVRVDEDFQPRLETRIHQLRNETAVARTMGTGGSTVTILSLAAVILAVAWSPLLFVRTIQVELAPITVSRPGPRGLGIRLPDVSVRPASNSPAALDLDHDLFTASNALLFQYSPVARRYRSSGTRSGIQE